MKIESEVMSQYIKTLLEVTASMAVVYPPERILEAVYSQLEMLLLMLED